MEEAAFPVRVLYLLGITVLIVTNAAGGLNPEYKLGDIVVLNDHINLPGLGGIHPLRGPNMEEFGPRFPALSDAYDLALRRRFHLACKSQLALTQSRRGVHEGVYAFVSGPRYVSSRSLKSHICIDGIHIAMRLEQNVGFSAPSGQMWWECLPCLKLLWPGMPESVFLP